MSLKSFIFRKKMERHLPEVDRALNPTTSGLKAYLRTSYLLYTKPWLMKTYDSMKFISKVPFPLLFVFFLVFVVISFGIFAQVEYRKWTNAISILYPESVLGTINPENGQLMPSPLDSVMIPYNAKRIGLDFFHLNELIALFLGITWKLHNDGTPQSFRFRGHNG